MFWYKALIKNKATALLTCPTNSLYYNYSFTYCGWIGRNMLHRKAFCLPIILTLLLAGCTFLNTLPESTPTLVLGTFTSTPSPLPTHTLTPYWSPTASLPVLPTGSATPTQIPTPTFPLSQEGPWLVFTTWDGLWVANKDGTGLTRIFEFGDAFPLSQFSVSPHGGNIAFIPMPYDVTVSNIPQLMEVTLPSTTPKYLTYLLSKDPSIWSPEIDQNHDVLGAVSDDRNLAWSPDGTKLAFIGAQDGPSADLYVYSTLDDSITRLTNGDTQAMSPLWSPDGRYIVSVGARTLNIGRGGSDGPRVESIWSVQLDTLDLYQVENTSTYPYFMGWINETTFVQHYDNLCVGNNFIRAVNVTGAYSFSLFGGSYQSAALDPVSGTLLVKVQEAYGDICNPSHAPGLYLVSIRGEGTSKQINLEDGGQSDVLTWSPEANLFFVSSGRNMIAIDLQGNATIISVPESTTPPIVSPDGQDWAVNASRYNDGLWITSLHGKSNLIWDKEALNPIWSPDSSTLYFFSGEFLYQATRPDYKVKQIAGPFQYPGSKFYWVTP
jgi:Tol biopolymer transport system component